MSEKLVPFLMKQPHVTFATGTMGQPLGGFDVLTGIDLRQFNRLSGSFRFVRGGPFENDDDVIVDEYNTREKNLDTGSTITLANHAWRVSGIFESGKLSHICARLNVLQALTGNPARLSQIYLNVILHSLAAVISFTADFPANETLLGSRYRDERFHDHQPRK